MALRHHRLLGLAVAPILVVAVALCAWRLGLEVLLIGSLVVLGAAIVHPWLSTLALMGVSALSFVSAAGPRSAHPRGLLLLNRALVWLISIAGGVVLFQATAGGIIVLLINRETSGTLCVRPSLEHPLVGGLILFLLGLLWLMVLRLEPRRVVHLVTRAVVALLCMTAWIFSVEFVFIGIVSLGVEGWKSLEAYIPLAGGVLLGILYAAGVKWVFRLPSPHWAIALAAFAAVFVVIVRNVLQFLPLG